MFSKNYYFLVFLKLKSEMNPQQGPCGNIYLEQYITWSGTLPGVVHYLERYITWSGTLPGVLALS